MVEYKFGGSNFINCSLPLVFEDRYFIVEPGIPTPLISVVIEDKGNPRFEILKNEPFENPKSIVTKSTPGIISVVNRETNQFIYKVRPGSETSIVFGTIGGKELNVSVTDQQIQIGSSKIVNCTFNGVGAGVVINKSGGFAIGAPLPKFIKDNFMQKA
jgi:hypothetical protein